MPSDRPPPRRPSWLNDDAAPGASRKKSTSSEAGDSNVAGWRTDPTAEAPKKKARHVKIGLGIASVLLLIGSFIWLIYLLRPLHPACLILVGAPAEENLSIEQNVTGWQSLERLGRWVKQGESSSGWKHPKLAHDPRELTATDDWDAPLKNRSENVLVVYLALHGGADRDGAFFLIDGPGGEAHKNRLRLKTVLDRLKQLPRDKNKLLILDATQSSTDWSLGMLQNDFVRELEKQDAAIAEIPNLVIMSSTSADERSWVCEEWSETVFGHYIVDGISGAADTSGARRVTAGELFNHVKTHVQQWARSNRNRNQTPLLLPREDGPRRAQAMEITGVADNATPAASTAAHFQAPAELKTAWDAADKLATISPAPSVYSPHRWREYRDTLLRYEEIVRLGDPRGKAGSLFRRLTELERDIRQMHGMNLASVAVALPMPRALGLTPVWNRADVKNIFTQLTNAKDDEERTKAWTKAQEWAVQQGGTTDRLRLECYGLLLDQIAENPQSMPPDRLDTLCRRLGGAPRPAEAHFLFMFNYLTQRVLPGGPPVPSKLLQEALSVRRLAEDVTLGCWGDKPGITAHPYSEQIYPWIREKAEAADRQRRRGEDLIFATPDWWKQAEQNLAEARRLYEEAGRDALIVRESLGVRDQALADLPCYGRWLANRPIAAGQQFREANEVDLKNFEKLGKSVHQLARVLEQPVADSGERAAQLKQLASFLGPDGIPTALKGWETQYRQFCERLGDDATQDTYHMHEAALSVPLSPGTLLRIKLVNQMNRISEDLNAKGAQTLESVLEVDPRGNSMRQGRMALAVLGEESISSGSQIKALLDSPSGDWWITSSAAGDQIGRAWEDIPKKIGALLAAKPASGGAELKELAEAERLSREADSEGSRTLVAADPVTVLRRLRIQNMLLDQAQRMYRDHWFAERGAEPFYVTAMRKCVDDAETLALSGAAAMDASQRAKSPRLAAINKVRALIKPEPLKITHAPRVDWTSEQTLDLPYVLEPAKDILPGYPVLWRTVEGGTNDEPPLALVTGTATDRFVADALGSEPAQTSAPFDVAVQNRWLLRDEAKPPGVPTQQPAKVLLRGVFRGEEINQPIDVALHRVPHRTAINYPRLPQGGIALQSDPGNPLLAKDNGVLILVLDHSPSMDSKLGSSTRVKEARKAFEQVMKVLPEGLVVSVWSFGTMPPEGFPVNDKPWMKQVWKPQPWSADKHLDQVKALLEKELPNPKSNSGSPIADTIVAAAKTDLPAIARDYPESFKGFKNLLVLTDGDDNCYNLYHRGARDLPGDFLLRELKDYLQQGPSEPGLQLNLVFFADDKKEIVNARQQFSAIQRMPVPGKLSEFDGNNNSDNLALKMLEAIQQQWRCRLEHADGKPIGEGSPLDRFPSWFTKLKPSLYTLRIQTYKQDVEIGPDDYIPVTLTRRKDRVAFERTLIGKVHPTRDRVEANGWLLAAHQNMESATGGLELVTTLESLAVHPTERGTLLEYRPSFVWYELQPGQNTQAHWARWNNLERYPAPTWQLATGTWPTVTGSSQMELPTCHAWWLGDRAVPPVARELARDPANPLEKDFANRSVQIEDATVIVEHARMERRTLAIARGKEKEVRKCLVVRLRYPADKPFIVRLGKVAPAYEEHRLYTDASKYTGIFVWPDGSVPDKDFTLQLISLEDVKRAAKDAGTAGVLGKLGKPLLLDRITVPKVPD